MKVVSSLFHDRESTVSRHPVGARIRAPPRPPRIALQQTKLTSKIRQNPPGTRLPRTWNMPRPINCNANVNCSNKTDYSVARGAKDPRSISHPKRAFRFSPPTDAVNLPPDSPPYRRPQRGIHRRHRLATAGRFGAACLQPASPSLSTGSKLNRFESRYTIHGYTTSALWIPGTA